MNPFTEKELSAIGFELVEREELDFNGDPIEEVTDYSYQLGSIEVHVSGDKQDIYIGMWNTPSMNPKAINVKTPKDLRRLCHLIDGEL
jgi:hypothetical protein